MAGNASQAHHALQRSFLARATLPSTAPLAAFLFRLMDSKRSNLCVSADVRTTAELLALADELGSSIVVLKTHADTIDDFSEATIQSLKDIARREKFLLFEDRKFGDIGSTVQRQYTAGPLRIAQWASLVNAHIFPGPDIVRALQSAAAEIEPRFSPATTTHIAAEPDDASGGRGGPGKPRIPGSEADGKILSVVTVETRSEPMPPDRRPSPIGFKDGSDHRSHSGGGYPTQRALLLLAEMSSKGNLLTGAYTEQCMALAREHRDFVLGFIAQRSLNEDVDDNFITLTPGVSLPPESASASDSALTLDSEEQQKVQRGDVDGDGLGQQYNPPRRVVLERGSDIIIVGRGILHAKDRKVEAERYRREAWLAYQDRLGKGRPSTAL